MQEKQHELGHWLKPAIEADAMMGGADYSTCLEIGQYTYNELAEMDKLERLGAAVYGRQHIEGKIICEKLNVKLHVLEIEEHKLDDEDGRGLQNKLIVTHQLVDSKESKSVNENFFDSTIYDDKNYIHLALYKGHFVPLFSLKKLTLTNSSVAPSLSDVSKMLLCAQPKPEPKSFLKSPFSDALAEPRSTKSFGFHDD